MDELSEKLAEILNDPESMNRVRAMAESLLGNDNKQEENKSDFSNLLRGDGMPDIKDMQKIMSVFSRLNNKGDDSRTRLLLALKPHLSKERQEKVDSAVKILKFLELLPLLKESGLLGDFKI